MASREKTGKPAGKKDVNLSAKNKQSTEAKVQAVGTAAAAALQLLERQLKELEGEIEEDARGLGEMQRHLVILGRERHTIVAQIKEDEDFCNTFADEKSLGGLVSQFDGVHDR